MLKLPKENWWTNDMWAPVAIFCHRCISRKARLHEQYISAVWRRVSIFRVYSAKWHNIKRNNLLYNYYTLGHDSLLRPSELRFLNILTELHMATDGLKRLVRFWVVLLLMELILKRDLVFSKKLTSKFRKLSRNLRYVHDLHASVIWKPTIQVLQLQTKIGGT